MSCSIGRGGCGPLYEVLLITAQGQRSGDQALQITTRSSRGDDEDPAHTTASRRGTGTSVGEPSKSCAILRSTGPGVWPRPRSTRKTVDEPPASGTSSAHCGVHT